METPSPGLTWLRDWHKAGDGRTVTVFPLSLSLSRRGESDAYPTPTPPNETNSSPRPNKPCRLSVRCLSLSRSELSAALPSASIRHLAPYHRLAESRRQANPRRKTVSQRRQARRWKPSPPLWNRRLAQLDRTLLIDGPVFATLRRFARPIVEVRAELQQSHAGSHRARARSDARNARVNDLRLHRNR